MKVFGLLSVSIANQNIVCIKLSVYTAFFDFNS